MYRLFCALALFAAAPLAAQAPYELPRIGDKLTAQEVAYFGLFPSVTDFESARVSRTGSTTAVAIRRVTSPDTTVSLSTEQVVVLRQYLMLYEEVEAMQGMDLASIDGLFRFRKRFFAPAEVAVSVVEGPRLTGDLLYTDERALVLWTDEQPFTWRRAGDAALVVLSWEEVEEIFTTRKKLEDRSRRLVYGVGVGGLNLLAGAGAGAAGDAGFIGALPGLAGALSGALVAFGPAGDMSGLYVGGSRVEARTAIAALSRPTSLLRGPAFPAGVPPEIEALLPTAPTGTNTPAAARAPSAPARINRIKIAVNGTYLAPLSSTYDGTYVTGTSRETIGDVSGPLAAFHLDAAYALNSRIQAGVSSRIQSPASPDAFTALVSGSSVAPYVSFAVVRPSERMEAFTERFALAVGGGVSLGRSDLLLPFEFTPAVRGLDPSLPAKLDVEASTTGVGPYARAGLSFFTTQSTAVFLDIGYRALPKVEIEADERRYQFGTSSGVVYNYGAFSATPQPIEVTVGLSWHL